MMTCYKIILFILCIPIVIYFCGRFSESNETPDYPQDQFVEPDKLDRTEETNAPDQRTPRNFKLDTSTENPEGVKLDDKIEFEAVEGGAQSGWKIVGDGWPSTTATWPTIQSTDQSQQNGTSYNATEPFIYLDKPYSDYGLLVKLNQTTMEKLKSIGKPIAVDISFSHYFEYGPEVHAFPAIRIEVERKEMTHLKPNENLKTRIWHNYKEKITVDDVKKFENTDWLILSLVNRQPPSIVAIRRLKIEFSVAGEIKTEEKKPEAPEEDTGKPNEDQPDNFDSSYGGRPKKTPKKPSKSYPMDVDSEGFDPTTAALTRTTRSTLTNGSTKPTPKPNSFFSSLGMGRKKRDLSSDSKKSTTQIPALSTTEKPKVEPIVLTCYRADSCDIEFQPKEKIQWSLARMPPSTDSIKYGYYYVSNQHNFGDPSKTLRISLEETSEAKRQEFGRDHCIDLALFITEAVSLNLYSYLMDSNGWRQGNLLMTWTSTLNTRKPDQVDGKTPRPRIGLPGARLASLENGQNGWAFETLCFGDFFNDLKDCGDGKCGFGFKMHVEGEQPFHSLSPNEELNERNLEVHDPNKAEDKSASSSDISIITDQPLEQVIAISLLTKFASPGGEKKPHSIGLESWESDEVVPIDNWRFYPKQDYDIRSSGSSVSFINLYDNSRYYIQSEWIYVGSHLDLSGSFLVNRLVDGKPEEGDKLSLAIDQTCKMEVISKSSTDDLNLFTVDLAVRLLDEVSNEIFRCIHKIHWTQNRSSASYELRFPISDELRQSYPDLSINNRHKFKVEFSLGLRVNEQKDTSLEKLLKGTSYKISIANVSISDRCFKNPCNTGTCRQIGPEPDSFECVCDDKHRGKFCQFGRWCQVPHIKPYVINDKSLTQVLTSGKDITGSIYCTKKFGIGSKCTDIDKPLDDEKLDGDEEGITFTCSCQDEYYLDDDGKCRLPHPCNSILCPFPGMICDETLKPSSRPLTCKCDESQGWSLDPHDTQASRCIRQQCSDIERDCQFKAHSCIPTGIGEKPICKCAPKFTLVSNNNGEKYCKSVACNLPSLNDCHQICYPNDGDVSHPYTCGCHLGYELADDGKTCKPHDTNPPRCEPGCDHKTQFCTQHGCRCKQGYVGESQEVVTRTLMHGEIQYTKSIRCLNICVLKSSEKQEETDKVKSVCPLGICNPEDFFCKCRDPSLASLEGDKYEPKYSIVNREKSERIREPLCSLKQVCQPDSDSYKICQNSGAICVPDYTKPSMYDCICPPPLEKMIYKDELMSSFTCERKCGQTRSDCYRKSAICRQIDKGKLRCECPPGFIMNPKNRKCYLAKFSYSFNIISVNKYYDPNLSLYQFDSKAITSDSKGSQVKTSAIGHPDYNLAYNQCKITRILPKTVIEDPYENDVAFYKNYIDQCNEKVYTSLKIHSTNFKLAEDLRQTLKQHLKDFTVTTLDNSCEEVGSAKYINCTIYLQSQNDPVSAEKLEKVFNQCDKQGQSSEFCWVKPRLLLKRPQSGPIKHGKLGEITQNFFGFKQIIPCELKGFCGPDAISIRQDNTTSLCSCICPSSIEVTDAKLLEYVPSDSESKLAVKETCLPMNHCKQESTFCLSKPGSDCHYDPRQGSRCICRYPTYEMDGKCVSSTGQAGYTLQAVVLALGIFLTISFIWNVWACIKMKSGCGNSQKYQLNEYPSSPAFSKRPTNQSTGMPNPVFMSD